nr:reverse transcriptase domain-containing protein [Tanacetum cinerariifolium]
MPLSNWKKLSLSELTPTRMTLELADRSITRLKGVTEDIFVKVGKFHFPTDFVVVDFEPDPRVPLILGRSFLRIGRALIDVYREEITLRVNDEDIKEYAQEILGFSSNSSGGNTTSTFKHILSDSYPSLTMFKGSNFILEEIDAYLKDESISPKIDHADCDPKGAQRDTFYNGLNDNDQDSLNATAGENLLSKNTREALQIIENKSKVRYSRNKPNISRMNTTSMENASKSDDKIDNLADQISTLVDIFAKKIVTYAPVKAVEESCVTCGGSKVRYSRNKPNISRMNTTSMENASKSDDKIDNLADQISTLVDIFAKKIVTYAPVKAVEESCVTCGGNHAYYNCLNTDSNQPSVCVATGTYNQVAPQNRASNFMAPSGFAPNQSSTSGTLLSNTIPNPKGEMKAITTRSGVAYEGPLIPTPKKVVERETEETTDKEQSNFQGSTAYIQPPVTPISKPDVPKTLPKPNIPYPSRLNDQKLREKATNLMEKFFQIFQDLHFHISFADALILMPKFASTIKSLLTNKDKLFELAKIPLNENCSAMLLKNIPERLGDPGKFLIPCDFPGMDICHALADLGASINLMPLSIWKKLSLPELTPTRMTLKLADRSITRPKGVVEDVFIKVGKFHFPTNFVVVDFKADPRVNDESVTFNLNQTTRYSSTYDDLSKKSMLISRMSQFHHKLIMPIVPKGDICLIEKLLNNDPFQLPLMDLKQGEVVKAKYSIEEPPKLELKELPSHLEYAYLEGVDKLPVIISKDLKVDEKKLS